jgi:DNA-binding IclR family transcriptional regulator
VSNHDQIGHQINWVLTGHGQAYLAFAPNASGRVCSIRFEGPAIPRMNWRFKPRSCRNSSFVGGFYDRPRYSDGLAAIAVPVCWREKVYGAINLVWLKNAHTVDHMMRHRLTNLQAAASEITAAAQATTELAHTTELVTSHLPMLSKPKPVAAVIIDGATALAAEAWNAA